MPDLSTLLSELRRLNAARTPGEWRGVCESTGAPLHREFKCEIRGNAMHFNGKIVSSAPVCTLRNEFAWYEGDKAFILFCANNAAAIIEQLERVEKLTAENAKLRRVAEAAKQLDQWLDGWCPTQCSCASGSEKLHEKLHAALAELEGR